MEHKIKRKDILNYISSSRFTFESAWKVFRHKRKLFHEVKCINFHFLWENSIINIPWVEYTNFHSKYRFNLCNPNMDLPIINLNTNETTKSKLCKLKNFCQYWIYISTYIPTNKLEFIEVFLTKGWKTHQVIHYSTKWLARNRLKLFTTQFRNYFLNYICII